MNLSALLTRLSESESASSGTPDTWPALVTRITAAARAQLAPEQLAIFDDVSRLRVACCARQSGKSHMAARLMIVTAVSGPDRIVWYVSDTVDRACGVMWDDQIDGLPAVLGSLGLIDRRDSAGGEWHYEINLSRHQVTFRNGSWIRITGADRGGWLAFRGKKLDLLVIDEMQRQEQEALELALKKDLPDCTMARRGSIVGLGTVGSALKGIWWRMATGQVTGCTHHHWTARELSHLTNVWTEQLEYAAAMGIDTETDAEWLREKMGIWVRDEQRLLHVLTEAALWDGQLPDTVRTRCPQHGHLRGRCVCELPHVPRQQQLQVYAGLDLGAGQSEADGDPCAVVVCSVSPEEGIIRELHSERFYPTDTEDMVTRLRAIRERLGVIRFYIDGAWKMTRLDLGRLYGLPVVAADKGAANGTDEDIWVMERRTALRQGTMLVRRGSPLHQELETVLRDPELAERGHIRQAPGQVDHCTDSWRYAFRMIRTNHLTAPAAPVPEIQRLESEMLAQAMRQARPAPRDGRPRTAGNRR